MPSLPKEVKYPIIHIIWVDSCHTSGWEFWSDLKFDFEGIQQETVGFLIKETEYSLIVIQSKSLIFSKNDSVDGIMEIPKSAIIKVIELTTKKQKK